MEKYLHYNTEDFASEDSFINWVNNSNKNDVDFWNTWVKDNPSKKAVVDDARALVELLSGKEKVNQQAKDKIWANINDKTTDSTKVVSMNTTSSNRRGFLKYIVPLVAAAIIGVMMYLNTGNGVEEFSTLPGSETASVELPDGSNVRVDANSKLTYDKNTWSKDRKVNLSGEAFFEVKKGEQFTVVTPNGNVEVLGTSFSVYARDKDFKVNCKTGKVRVTQNGKEIAILTPDKGVKSINNVVTKTDLKKLYRRESIVKVFEDIQQEFGVKIDYDKSIEEIIYTGAVSFQSLESALEVCLVTGKSYEINGEIVKLVNE